MLLKDKIKTMIESNAKTINVERVSVWMLDKNHDSISTDNIYVLSKNEYLPGFVFKRNEYPNYFKALDHSLVIDANDAMNDPRTSEFKNQYLAQNGITSMLDVPIRTGGNLIGVLCHEHIGSPRIWTIDDVRFASSIADLIALAIENDEKTKIAQALSEIEKKSQLATNQKMPAAEKSE